MRLTNIQVLRIVAATSVLVFHLGHYAVAKFGADTPLTRFLNVGWFAAGVPVFFAISGYVLARSLVGTRPRTFLARRLLRLYPAYWVVALVAAVAVWRLPWDLLTSRVVFQGLSLLPFGPGQSFYPMGVEWTLVYEVAFSLALTAFAVVSPKRGAVTGCAVWLALCVGKMVFEPNPELVVFPLVRQLPFAPAVIPFLLGVLAYHLRDRAVGLRWWGLPAAAGFVWAAYEVGSGPRPVRMDVFTGLMGAASASLVWWATAMPQVSPRNVLVRQGDRSYGVYLVHVPVMVLAFGFAAGAGWPALPTVIGVGLAALALGLLYGEFDVRLYARLRRWTESFRLPRGGSVVGRAFRGRLSRRPRVT